MARTRLSSKRRLTAVFELAMYEANLLASVVPYLTAADLTSLCSTCRGFGAHREQHGGESSLSMVQEAARRAILREQTKTERVALVRYPGESWIAVYHQLLELRAPLSFDVLSPTTVQHEDGGTTRVIFGPGHGTESPLTVFRRRFGDLQAHRRTFGSQNGDACSKHVMRGGKHFVEFSNIRGYGMMAGLMTPPLSTAPKNGCMFQCSSGLILRSNWDVETRITDVPQWEVNHLWRRRQQLEFRIFPDDPYGNIAGEIGLLLDLDAGTLTAYMNGRRLGVICEGLVGEYCWVTSGLGAISVKRGAIPDDAEHVIR